MDETRELWQVFENMALVTYVQESVLKPVTKPVAKHSRDGKMFVFTFAYFSDRILFVTLFFGNLVWFEKAK